MPRNIDRKLEELQPPLLLLSALKPEHNMSVEDFLALPYPQRPNSRTLFVQGMAWFSSEEDIAELDIPTTVQSIILPSSRTCRILDDLLRDAIENQQHSVRHPVKENVLLPLWTVRVWKWANRLLENRTFWLKRLAWADVQGELEGWDSELRKRVKQAIQHAPWQGGLRSLQRGGVSINHLARVMLSDEWLTGDAVDCILDTIRAEASISGIASSIQIAEASLCQVLENGTDGTQANYWGKELADGRIKNLTVPWNIPFLHWLWFEIDVEDSCIRMGDSKQGVSKSYLNQILLCLHRWLKVFLPQQNFHADDEHLLLDVGEQRDSFSCGIAVGSGIRHRVCPSFPLWDPAKPFKARAEFFVECVLPKMVAGDGENEIGISKAFPTNQATAPSDIDPHSSYKEDSRQRRHRVRKYARAEYTLLHDSPSESGSDDGYATPPKALRGRVKKQLAKEGKTEAKVPPKIKASHVPNTVADLPPWFDEPKFLKFQRKIYEMDPNGPEFDFKDQKLVICGRCRKPVSMREKNNTVFFASHRKSAACQKGSGIGQTGISTFFSVAPSNISSSSTVPCPGITNLDHPRVSAYLQRTVVSHGGATARNLILNQILEDTPALKKNKTKLNNRIQEAERAEATWQNDHLASAVYSVDCLKKVSLSSKAIRRLPCFACAKLLRNRILLNALRRPTPDPKNAKFTPKSYQNPIIAKASARHADIHELLFMPESSRWLTLARRASKSRYKGYEAFMGVCTSIMEIEDRHFRGKGLQNMKYDTCWDTICTSTALISPRCYRMIRKELGGRGIRSIQKLAAKAGRFQAGMPDVNFDGAEKWVKDMGYVGPLGLAVDDTKLTPAIRSYKDGSSWKVAGMHGVPITIESYDELLELGSMDRTLMADKVRAWLLIVPLPGIPPRILATLPICSKVSKSDIGIWHKSIEKGLSERGLHYISYSVDGASTERGFGHILENSAPELRTWSFEHPLYNHPPLLLQAPLLPNGKPRVICTDGKHSKKNGRGSATSGARVLAMGNYLVHYGMLADLVLSEGTPLVKTDIIGVDKQDDRAAARLFSGEVIEHIHKTQPAELGLAIYLFILGEVIDAQQNRSISHEERVKMLWRGRFFLDGWRDYVLAHPHYNVNTHFITRELYDILSIFINAMLLLILIHRDYFPQIPLCLWLHSTEVCEHFFGCARQIQANYTAEQWIMMIPKIILYIIGQMKRKGIQANASEGKSGYHHFWFDTTGIDIATLTSFPSNTMFQQMIDIGFFEAERLLAILGLDGVPTSVEAALKNPVFLDAVNRMQQSLTTTTGDPEGIYQWGSSTLNDDTPLPVSVEDILAMDGEDIRTGASVPIRLEQRLADIGSAAVADAIHASIRIDELPEHGAADEEEWRETIANLARVVQEASTEPSEIPPASEKTTAAVSRDEARSQAKSKALNFGTPDSFKFDILVKERLRHETEEVKSAISHRFRHAKSSAEQIQEAEARAAEQKKKGKAASEQKKAKAKGKAKLPAISSVQPQIPEGEPEDTADAAPVLDVQVVNQLARLVSDSLTGTGKKDTSGLERLARWKMIGISGKLEEFNLALPQDEVEASNGRRQVYIDARRLYSPLQQKLSPFDPVTGGISPFHPLRMGSWVLVYLQSKVYVAQVKAIYVEGGGKTPSHNYTPSCSDILKISRLVALLFQPLTGVFYTPLITQPLGYRQVPSFAFLHQADIIGSLDMLGPIMHPDTDNQPRARFAHGIYLERPKLHFDTFMKALDEHIPAIMVITKAVIKACDPHTKKRGAAEDPDTPSGSLAGKRQKA